MIELNNLTKVYQLEDSEVRALDNVSIKINRGEFAIILGQSGCGKSTLLNLLGGMDKPTSGEIVVDGEDLSKKKLSRLAKYRGEKVGMVFQKFNLISDMSVLENVMLPLKFIGLSESEQRKRALKVIDSVGLKDKINSIPAKLSGGQQQRVAIARALVNEPEILLCDEPTGNLDSKTGKEIIGLLRQLNKEGRTIIMVTHNEQYSEFADRVIKMLDGKVIDQKVNHKKKEKKTTQKETSKNISLLSGARLAFKNVNRRKFRMSLTAFGISIGAMAILILVSFGAGMQNEAQKQIKAYGQVNEIIVSNTKATGTSFGSGQSANNFVINEQVPLNDNTINDLKTIVNVKAIYPSVKIVGEAFFGDKLGRLSVQNIPPLAEDQGTLKDKVKYGQFFTSDDQNSAILPYGLAQALGFDKGQDIIGKEITLKSEPDGNELKINIIGVFDENEKTTYQTYLPVTTAVNFLKKIKSAELSKDNPGIYDAISVISKDNASVDSISKTISNKGYTTHNYADTAKTLNRVFVMLQVGLGIIGGIAMLVAALGIINTMMMSILERTKEIGIMKAVGARQKDISTIFLIEASTIGIIGGIIGLVLGYPGSRVASMLFNRMVIQNAGGDGSVSFYIAPYLALGVLGFSILVAIIAGYFPARRGANLDPVVALRDE